MEVALATADDFDFAVEKKIQLACKAVFGSPGTLGDGFDQALGVRAPVNDQAGLGQGETANEIGGGFFQWFVWFIVSLTGAGSEYDLQNLIPCRTVGTNQQSGNNNLRLALKKWIGRK